jgi:hypothetical protein
MKFIIGARHVQLRIEPVQQGRVEPENGHRLTAALQHRPDQLWEEVKFDDRSVTSIDWKTYPIVDMTEAPEAIDIILIDHPELAPTGAGEASSRPTAGALANAIFDATGIRLRQAPFTPERLKAGLA